MAQLIIILEIILLLRLLSSLKGFQLLMNGTLAQYKSFLS